MKVLVIKIGAIGDVALSLPILHLFPKDEITWVIGKSASPLIKATKKVQHIIEIEDQKLLTGGFFEKIAEVLLCLKKLAFKKFDLVITAHPDPRYRILSLFCLKKRHRFFTKKEFPLTQKFHGEEYLQLAKADATQSLLQYDNLLMFSKVGQENPNQIVLYPGGTLGSEGKALRKWPVSNYAELAKKLISSGYEVILIGSKEDAFVRPYFQDVAIQDLIGQTSLLELVDIMRDSIGIISHDAGPLHLARLAGCKILGLFGPTSQLQFAREDEKESTLFGGDELNCSPCYNGKTFPICSTSACMKQITVESVVKWLKEKWKLKIHENSNSARLALLDIRGRKSCRSNL